MTLTNRMIKSLSILLAHEKKSLKENTEAEKRKKKNNEARKKNKPKKNTEARTRVDQGNVTRLRVNVIINLIYNVYILYFI